MQLLIYIIKVTCPAGPLARMHKRAAYVCPYYQERGYFRVVVSGRFPEKGYFVL